MNLTGVWERLTSNVSGNAGGIEAGGQPSLLRRAIVQDLEVLLNTRTAIPADALAEFPFCRDSIVNFGLADFAHCCLASSLEREEVCRRLAAAITRHEPRLLGVQVQLVAAPDHTPDHINQLSFVIHGRLRGVAHDSVRLDLTLQPSSLRYTIR